MRCKVIKPKGAIVLKYTSTAKNPFAAQLSRSLEQGFPQILLEYSAVAASPSSWEVRFDVTRMVTLSEYLKTPMSAALLLGLFGQVKQLLDTCIAMQLPLMNVVFDMNQVYYDSWLQSLRFLYLPFEGIAPDPRKAQTFFASIASKVRPADAEASRILTLYGDYVRSVPLFDPAGLSSCLGNLGTPNNAKIGHNPAAGRSTGGPKHADPASSERIIHDRPASASHMKKNVLTPGETTDLSTLPPSETPELSPSKKKKKEDADVRGKHALIDPGTGVLNAVMWNMACEQESARMADGVDLQASVVPEKAETTETNTETSESDTTVLNEPAPTPKTHFWLVRARTGERVEVKGDHFVVGKSMHSSFQVHDTTTVSRSHALFFCQKDECWIEDDESKNGTFVNDEQLAPHMRRRLQQGDVVRLSDEDFAFEEERANA